MVQQKALLLLEQGGAHQVQTIDIPKPGPGDVLVKVIRLSPMAKCISSRVIDLSVSIESRGLENSKVWSIR